MRAILKGGHLVSESKNCCVKDFPVDIVYLWCDSSDSDWQKLKTTELQKYNKVLDKDSISNCRFINNNELKYSLRSLEIYAPWIRNIYIVTNGQIPEWIDVSNEKIHIINHKEILPEDALPTFNSVAIETAIHKIPGLSENFLYANDDMFFGNFVDKSFFFTNKGRPIFRFSSRRIVNKHYRHLYGYTVSRAYNLIKEKFGKSFPYFPHHNIDAYKKSDIEKCYCEFKQDFEKTACQKFREKNCIQRSIYGYYSIANSLAENKISDISGVFSFLPLRKASVESMLVELEKSKLKLIDKYKPFLFCFNDSLNTTDEDRFEMKKFLEEKFPQPSSFEKPDSRTAEICVCYHKEFDLIKNEILTPIQVGAELSDKDLGIQKDNTGDNISSKNKNYCELTALYWLWKNSDADYKGLMHYRRLLDLNCNKKRWYNRFPNNIADILGLNRSQVVRAFEDFDVIVPMKRVIQQSKTAYEYYRKRHYISDMDRTLEIIKEKTPEIYHTAVDVMKNSRELYLYNIFISSKEFLDEYAKWLFDILYTLEFEIQPDVEVRDTFQQRVYGFLSERLFTIYVEYKKSQGLKVLEVPVVYCETNKKRYDVFQLRTKIYSVLTKFGIRRPHWKEQYGV